MRTAFDFSPLYRSSIGFDRVVDLLENASRVTTIDNWPPYDIARRGDLPLAATRRASNPTESEMRTSNCCRISWGMRQQLQATVSQKNSRKR